jgi:hypothetical protein
MIPPKMSYDVERERYKVEYAEGWRDMLHDIPALRFPPHWHVRMSPPFSGAIVRFRVSLDGDTDHESSVYLDVWDRIGYMGEPYWEVYPYQDDVGRCPMNDTVKLMDMIEESARSQVPK